MKHRIHFQLKDESFLCRVRFANSFTNDKDSVTCRKCKYLLKIMEEEKNE